MTAATITARQRVRPTVVERLALTLGLALVAWSRRAAKAPSREDLELARAAQTQADEIARERAMSLSAMTYIG